MAKFITLTVNDKLYDEYIRTSEYLMREGSLTKRFSDELIVKHGITGSVIILEKIMASRRIKY